MEMIRFICVSVIGVVIDLVIAWAAAHFLGITLWLAAAIGFIVAAIGNYALHERWTFRSGAMTISRKRAAQYVTVSTIALLVRLAVVATLDNMVSDLWPIAILLAGVSVSFAVNFLLSKFVVFARATEQ